jgi:prepilin-type N-terminal cleavage/methylation domain-containing protein
MTKKAFTLIELLTVIAIISILMAIIIPAVQSARESARRTHCANNIYQLTKGIIQYESKWVVFPSGGWGNKWLGKSSRIKNSQPGGWTFSLLPYIEEEVLYENPTYYSHTVGTFNCPSRRSVQLYEDNRSYYENINPARTSRSDYAINGGSSGTCPSIDALIRANIKSNDDVVICHKPPGQVRGNGGNSIKQKITSLSSSGHRNHKHDHVGICGSCNDPLDLLMNQPGCQPTTLSEGDSWLKQNSTTRFLNQGLCGVMPDITDGIVGRMKVISNANLIDGASNVYLIGEKYVGVKYHGGDGDDKSMFVGFSNNNVRWGYDPPMVDGKDNLSTIFGSSHHSIFVISFADGRVESVSYDIDPNLHFILCGRQNGSLP